MRAQFSSSVTASPPAGPQAFDALIALAIIALGMSAWSNTRVFGVAAQTYSLRWTL